MKYRALSHRGPRRAGSSLRLVAVILALTMVGPIQPWATLAEDAFDCSVNGFCLSSSISDLLGLPQGKLNIVTYKPWDRVVKNPAAAAWGPIEAEARAAMAGLHGVANDTRLPHAALEDLRAMMFIRLVSIAKKKADGGTLTSVEQDALDTFSDLIVARRVRAAEKALEEYARWEDNRCGYTVPAGFGFVQYDPGPCGHGLPSLNPPRPPTKEQFTAYGGALAMKEANEAIKNIKRAALGIDVSDETFTYDPAADAEAAFRDADEALAIEVGVAAAVLVGGAAAIAATASLTVASTFAAAAGSIYVLGAEAAVATGPLAAFTAGGVVAASIPAIIIISVVVAVVATIQFAEDQSILPALQESLEESRRAPDIWALASSEEPLNRVELFATVVNQTLPSFDEERLAGVAPVVPSERQAGDPRFEVGGVVEDVLTSVSPESKPQETFMSQGWFVTRTLSAGVWGPWRWSLYLHYVSFTGGQLVHHTAGIQPGGFFALQQLRDADGKITEVTAAAKVSELHVFSPSALADRTVKWHGNRAPRLAPIVSEEPKAGVPLTFQANASDPDSGDSIAAIKWFIQDPIYEITIPGFARDLAECSFNPPGRIVDGLPAQCPWRPVDGASFDFTFGRSGTYGVLVMARDSEGAVTQEQFNVVIGAVAPTLTIMSQPQSGLETVDVTVGGILEFPYFSPGRYRAVTKLVIEWGDGALTEKWYPCRIPTSGESPSPEHCLADFDSSVGALFRAPAGVTDSPWNFSFSHSYAHRADQPLPNPAAIKVHAITNEAGRSQTERFVVTIGNVPPAILFRPVCPLAPGPIPIICTPIYDYRDVPFGEALKIRGRVEDHPLATHFVHVLWGDGTHTAQQAGCTDSGCPGFGEPWEVGPAGKDMDLIHAYAKPGSYPIKIIIDDRGPGGRVEYLTQSVIYGISKLEGPGEAEAESPVTYTYETVTPAGLMPSVTPTCEGGTVTAQSASSFTCEFDDVTSLTEAEVKLTAVIAGHSFERTLDVDVVPATLKLSPIAGPLHVTEGTTATFTYSAMHIPPGTVTYTPSCGPYGTVEEPVDGVSFKCRFGAVSAVTPTIAAVTATVDDTEAYSELALTIEQDTTGPVLTLPSTIQRDSTSNAGAVVTFSASASDAISGTAAVSCAPQSGSVFPIGSTIVNCSATDWQNNTGSGSFTIVVVDKSAPILTLPGSMTVNATGPAGAAVTFSATATDADPLSPTVACTPASGSTFPITTTKVSCTVADAAGNSASGSFAVTVTGPLQQIANLESYVRSLSIDKATKSALLSWIEKAKKSIAAGKPAACVQLTGLAAVAQLARGSTLTIEQADRILADVARIKAVLGC